MEIQSSVGFESASQVSPWRRFFAALLWLFISVSGGTIAAFTLGGHGAVVIIAFAAAIGLPGAVAHSAILGSSRYRSMTRMRRITLVWAIAIAPLFLISVFGAAANSNNSIGDGAMFLGSFCGPAFALSFVANHLVETYAEESM